MAGEHTYSAKQFDLHGLNGISDRALDTHITLYEGYVKATNNLVRTIRELIQQGKVDQEKTPAYSELTRRLGFEYNGMVLHELYFGNLTRRESRFPGPHSSFQQALEQDFGSFENWKADFTSVGTMRGVGWAICYLNPANGLLSNHWISLHEHGNVAGFQPILVMDVWEHAYILDYLPSDRKQYIEAFFSNVDWAVIETRLDNQAG